MARLLAGSGRGKPGQVLLRRSISTAYYAMFHALARNCADMLIGTSKETRSRHAWAEVYRSLSHGAAKSACEDKNIVRKFPVAVADFATAFAEMQGKRHAADYDPGARFYKSAVNVDIDRVERVIKGFQTATAKDRRAFASWVLFRNLTRSR